MTTKRVAIVSETFRPEVNGVANTLGYWSDGLIQQGFEVEVIRPRQTASDHGSSQGSLEQVTTTGLPIPRYPELKFGLPCTRMLFKRWSRIKPDAIYVATEGPLGWSACRAAKKLGIPVISGFHTNFQQYSEFYGFGALQKIILGYLRRFHNATVSTLVPTRTQAEYLYDRGFRNVKILSRGVDCALFNPGKRSAELRASWGVSDATPVCIYVGRLAHEKNVRLIAKAYDQIQSRYPDVRFVFVGDGPARLELEQSCPRAIFAGMQRGDDLAKHYASGDLFLFPSKTDTFGNVVTEAMASGLAVVSFNDAAAKEHLHHKISGMLAPLNDEQQFIEHIDQLVGNATLLSTVRNASLKLAQKISWKEIVDRFAKALGISSDTDESFSLPTTALANKTMSNKESSRHEYTKNYSTY